MRSKFVFLLFLALMAGNIPAFSQSVSVNRVDPPNWWAGFQDSHLNLLIRGENLEAVDEVQIDAADIELEGWEHLEHPGFLSIRLMSPPSPKKVEITLMSGKKKTTFDYEFKKRSASPRGLSPKDFIYLVFPDRFANGRLENDQVEGMQEMKVNRNEMFDRHGGDIAGIINHLDYLKSLGTTALWVNPVLENDQPATSYHGYAATDHYKIDPRFGTNTEYVELGQELHRRDMKLIMDVVFNHVGDQHYLYTSQPEQAMFNQWKEYQQTSYRAPTLIDPYASERDKKIMADGWFDKHMPDLNQRNPLTKNYLIQNCIWWIETAEIDAFRIDTYAYSDLDFMSEMASRIRAEYPTFFLFGETWVHGVPIQSFFTENVLNKKGFNSHIQGVTDFQLYYGINDALTRGYGWTEGFAKLYYTLAKDYVYKDPYQNVTFLDNHDLSRFYSVAGEDYRKWKVGMTLLMTLRGIPMIYYGSEILMKNFADPDGKVRDDFPGGWPTDKQNKFKAEGRTEMEQMAWNYVQALAKLRSEHTAFTTGKLTQFVPDKDHYVYFRHDEKGKFMVVVHSNEGESTLKTARFSELISIKSSLTDAITGKPVDSELIEMKPWEVKIIEIK